MVSGSCALPPRWPPQCSCVVIESSFDPGERLQAPGSLWSSCCFKCEQLPTPFLHVVLSVNNYLPLFSSPGPKVHVNYCHHLASVVCRLSSVVCRLSSVVCKLFTFQASSPKPLGRLEPNLAGMFLGWSSTKLLFFVPVGYSIWLPGPIICSDWLKFQRSSSPKLMN